MSNDNNPKSGVAPAQAASPKPKATKAIAPEDKQANEPTIEAKAGNPKPRQERVLMHGESNNVPEEAKDPNFHFRWCADYDKGKIQSYQGAWWEFVLRDGEKIKRPDGEPLYLMKLPKEIREQDLLAKRGKIVDINKQLQKEHMSVQKGGKVPDYIPHDGDSVVIRDDI